MSEQHEQNQPGKINIGRLSIDPVFLLIFLLFAASSLLLAFFMWLIS